MPAKRTRTNLVTHRYRYGNQHTDRHPGPPDSHSLNGHTLTAAAHPNTAHPNTDRHAYRHPNRYHNPGYAYRASRLSGLLQSQID